MASLRRHLDFIIFSPGDAVEMNQADNIDFKQIENIVCDEYSYFYQFQLTFFIYIILKGNCFRLIIIRGKVTLSLPQSN